MKKLYLLLTVLLAQLSLSTNAQGLIYPEEGGEMNFYSMGAWFEASGDVNWQGGYIITTVTKGDKIWFSNLFPDNFMDAQSETEGFSGMSAWIEGKVNGNRITVTHEKPVYHFKSTETGKEYDLYVAMVGVNKKSYAETLKESFDFIIDDNGNINLETSTTEDLYVCLLQLNDGEPIIGDNGIQTEDYVLGNEFIKLTADQLKKVEIPASVEMEPYTYSVSNYQWGDVTKESYVGFSGSDVYVKGMSSAPGLYSDWSFPDVVFKGTLAADGQSFTLPSEQFYGVYDYLGVYFATYMYGAYPNGQYYDKTDSVTFNKQGDKWVIEKNYCIVRASLDDTLYSLEQNIVLTPGYDAVEQIAADGQQQSAERFNLLGQKVTDGTKGIIIQNGKKFVK